MTLSIKHVYIIHLYTYSACNLLCNFVPERDRQSK